MSANEKNGKNALPAKKLTIKELKAQIKLNGVTESGSGIYSSIVEKSSDKLLDLTVNHFSQYSMAKVFENTKSPTKNDKSKSVKSSPEKKNLRRSPRTKNNEVPNLNKILEIDQPPERTQTCNKLIENLLYSSAADGSIEEILDKTPIEYEYDGNSEFLQSQPSSSEILICPSKKFCTGSIRDECTIRVKYNDVMHRFRLKMDEKFDSLFNQLGKELKINPSRINLYRKTDAVKKHDTADSLNFGFAEILDCFIHPTTETEPEPEIIDANKISLKFQSQDRREAISLIVDRNASFASVKEQYAKKKNLNQNCIVFTFDGDKIENDETPVDLDLEDDYCIDVSLKV